MFSDVTAEIFLLQNLMTALSAAFTQLLLMFPIPPSQCWNITLELRTQTVQFCTTLKRGDGGEKQKRGQKC